MSLRTKIFFIGIGGIGVSAMAQMALSGGAQVSGSDLAESEITKMLRDSGIAVTIGQSLDFIPAGTELVVYSNALKKSAPDFLQKLQERFSLLSYPEYVAKVTKGMRTIAIAGTHGKTTTTGMISKILLDAKRDPTIIIGSILKDIGSNFRVGGSDLLVLEADEYQKAFLNYWPQILVITNIAEDHLEYYGSLAHIQETFRELARRVPSGGAIICNPTDPQVAPILTGLACQIIDYTAFDLEAAALPLPGAHNRANARAALALAQRLGVDRAGALSSLASFGGTWRRFELRGVTDSGALVYDDYAHNPEKIRAALSGARELYPDKKIIAVFQPHLYSRTKLQFAQFLKSFDDADKVVVLPIFASREKPDPSISSEMFVRELSKSRAGVQYVATFAEAVEQLSAAREDSIIVLLGAGDIYTLSKQLLSLVNQPVVV